MNTVVSPLLGKQNYYHLFKQLVYLALLFSLINKTYSQKENNLNVETIIWLNRIDSCLNIKQGEKIVDIGSGDLSNLTIIASRHPEAVFFATDIKFNYHFSKKKKIKKLCEKYKIINNKNIFTSKSGSNSTKLKSNYYDKVILLNTFHDLSKIDAVILDINRILKKDGYLIIEEPFQELETTFKFKECYRPFFTEKLFKEYLSKLKIEILSESVVYKPSPDERYFIRKQFKCKLN